MPHFTFNMLSTITSHTLSTENTPFVMIGRLWYFQFRMYRWYE